MRRAQWHKVRGPIERPSPTARASTCASGVKLATVPGHGGAARRLAPNTLPLPGFTAWVRNGTPGWTFAAGMPAFPATVISDGELADIRTYLASLPPPPAVADLPLLAP